MPGPQDLEDHAAIPVYRALKFIRAQLGNDGSSALIEAGDDMGAAFHVEFDTAHLPELVEILSQLWTTVNKNRNSMAFFEVTASEAHGLGPRIGIAIDFARQGDLQLELNESTARILHGQLDAHLARIGAIPGTAALN